VLIEHYGGNFPLWLSPVHAAILTITDSQLDYASQVKKKLEAAGLRVKEYFINEKINKKIRTAELEKIPYMLVIGSREQESNSVMVRKKGGRSLGQHPVDEWIQMALEEIKSRAI